MPPNNNVSKTYGSSGKKSQISNDKKAKVITIDVETPNKSNFEFGSVVLKSNDKLSS